MAGKIFDYIVLGAGSAGCAMAARLSENPDVSVLLLEAGGWDRNPLIKVPIGWGMLIQRGVDNWNYQSEPIPALGGRTLPCPCGKVMGGTSSINTMAYVRGHRQDYDDLADASLPGWAYDDVLPYFRKQENWEGGASDYRGADGPISTGKSTYDDEVLRAYKTAAGQAGHPWNNDYNGPTQEGFSRMQLTLRNGRRCSAATGYIRPALKRRNLTIRTGARVARINLDGQRASGVDYIVRRRRVTAEARAEVVLCAGTFNSPQILMLSGIGEQAALKRFDIECKFDLPGVGANLHDHYGVSIGYQRRVPGPFHANMRLDKAAFGMARAYLTGTGFASQLPGGITAFVKSTPQERLPDLQLLFVGAPLDASPYLRPLTTPYEDRFFTRVIMCRPEGRGSVGLTSSNPFAAPRIEEAVLSTQSDMNRLREGVKIFREVGRQQALSEHCEEIGPGADKTSDSQIDEYIRSVVSLSYHPAGTCRMGTDLDRDAVVGADCRVHGLDNLRVVDASIFPTPLGGNINAPIIMAAEKIAAEMRTAHD